MASPDDYGIKLKELKDLMENRGRDGVKKVHGYGGVPAICQKLKSSPVHGINEHEVADRNKVFGRNIIPQKSSTNFLVLMWESLQDPTIIILLLCALMTLLLSLFMPEYEADTEEERSLHAGFYESIGIFITVLIVSLVCAFSDFSKERQFRGLQKKMEKEQKFTVIREGSLEELSVLNIVVGDICQVKYGDLLPADGLVVQSNDLQVDESSLTGESEYVKKGEGVDVMLYSGTSVLEGSGRMLVTAVGVHSQSGIILTLLGAKVKKEERGDAVDSDNDNDDDDEDNRSVLQIKLSTMAMQIGEVGLIIAVLTVIILLVQNSIEHFLIHHDSISWFHADLLVKIIVVGITVLVVAIPEGLPLAVTLSLAYSVRKMMADHNLVRHLHACETMGNATAICSDKTGTLTTNRMTVVQSYICEIMRKISPKLSEIPSNVGHFIIEGISVNSAYTSRLKPSDIQGGLSKQLGNRTECALLGFVQDLDKNYEEIRSQNPEENFVKVYTFSSVRKSMSTVIRKNNGFRMYTKGASEIILGKCSNIHGRDGKLVQLSSDVQKRILTNVVEPMAQEGLRTITLAYRDFEQKQNWNDESNIVSRLTCLCIVGIQDPVRPEVPDAIRNCQKAGITVRMVTGDNVETARSIAMKCGIINDDEEFLIMEGPEFNKRIRDNKGVIQQHLLDQIWPQLRVLARSSPTDKYNLVKGIINSATDDNREIVAVTGDGTNDGPALKRADVGFAMGLAGTDVAKQASDIILLDDNFTSMVKAVMWGRNVYDNICKFLQFQLTVNVVAVIVAFMGACAVRTSPLGAVQMLWVNLIMDSLGSLALATDMPTPELLERKPYGRTKSLLSNSMTRNIMGHALYQLCVIFGILFFGEYFLEMESGRGANIPTAHFTVIFNAFVLMTLCSELTARKLQDERNIFKGLHTNVIFILIWVGQLVVQVGIVQFGGALFSTVALSLYQWLWCIFFALGILVWHQIVITVPAERVPRVHYWELQELDMKLMPVARQFQLQQRKNVDKLIFRLRGAMRLRTQTGMPSFRLHNTERYIERKSIFPKRPRK